MKEKKIKKTNEKVPICFVALSCEEIIVYRANYLLGFFFSFEKQAPMALYSCALLMFYSRFRQIVEKT